jgi:superoxide reductase
MKTVELLKRAFFVLAGISLIIMFTYCGNDDEAEDTETDTTEVVEKVKKTREELIINRDTMSIANLDSITDFESKHTPDIIVGETNDDMLTEVTISFGINGIIHPSEDNHWLDYVKIFLDGQLAETQEKDPGPGSQTYEFLLDLSNVKEIKAEAGCNLHGIWFNTKSLVE